MQTIKSILAESKRQKAATQSVPAIPPLDQLAEIFSTEESWRTYGQALYIGADNRLYVRKEQEVKEVTKKESIEWYRAMCANGDIEKTGIAEINHENEARYLDLLAGVHTQQPADDQAPHWTDVLPDFVRQALMVICVVKGRTAGEVLLDWMRPDYETALPIHEAKFKAAIASFKEGL